ncbi:MAG: hypothetical protein A2045_01435 [Rhodocyclales bacterium GWA2_65_20]|nr:MAG: hypothetical protein A2045_01435 [Rhodocyclales bacterium GWA2_65_20]
MPSFTLLLDEAIELPEPLHAKLASRFTVAPWHAADAITRAQADTLLLHSRVGEADLQALAQCRYIGVRAHNTDYVPIPLRRDGLLVQGIPQFGTESVAEHTLALIFALAKNLRQGHEQTVSGAWHSGMQLNSKLSGKTLGIVGYGKIGQCVAQMARAFGLQVLVAAKPGVPAKDGMLPLEQLLRQADIVSLHTSTKADTTPVWDAVLLAQLKPGALLINTARGSLIDYDALGQMVLDGRISGVGLDVYPEEPPQLDWLNHQRVLCSPHMAYATDSTLAAMNGALVELVLAWAATQAS